MRFQLDFHQNAHGVIITKFYAQFLGPYPNVVKTALFAHGDFWWLMSNKIRAYRKYRGWIIIKSILVPSGDYS